MYITTNLELEDFCNSLADAKFISIDTEFFRQITYYSQLCLIQIYDGKQAIVIDALSKGLDLSILDKILQDPNIVKVFHSAKQDLEILLFLTGKLPKNIFDTQLAASFCGLGNSISYEALVNDLLNKKIDKSHCLSDWTKRPLSKEQLDYAMADVTYLYELYSKLILTLKENNRLDWVIEEINYLNQNSSFIIDPEKAWRKLKNTQKIKINIIIKKLAAWRELKAQEANLPRNHYLNEKYLFKLAKDKPITLKELKQILSSKQINNKAGEEIIEIIQAALSKQIEDDLSNNHSSYKKINSAVFSQLKSILLQQAEKYLLPSNIIATTEELKELSHSHIINPTDNRIFNGWRAEVFGNLIENHLTRNQDSDNEVVE